MQKSDEKISVLFLCTGNSCRSQMAEGWTRAIHGDAIEAHSAGVEIHGLNPSAVKVMAEAGVDISGHTSQHIDEFKDVDLDVVVTVCGHANESCPVFPGKTRVVHVGFDDPPRMAAEVDGEEEKLECYRNVRDDIRSYVLNLLEGLVAESVTTTLNIEASESSDSGSCCGSGGGCGGGGCCS